MMNRMAKKLSKPRLGQHFLMHPRIAERIVAVSGVGRDRALSEGVPSRARRGDTVLEVGPGKGILTEALLAAGAKVVAVETNAALIGGLRERFAEEIAVGRLELLHDDIRTYLSSHYSEPEGTYSVVANIPYYLTGELIRALLTREHQPSRMTLLVQKEVAERIAVGPERSRGMRKGKESLLSLSVRAYGEPHYEFTVPRGAFVPAPSVDSAVISIRDISRRLFKTPADEANFFALIHAGFAHKRKYLRNNLAAAGLPGEGVPEKARAEDLAFTDWLTLSKVEGLALASRS